MPFGPEIRNNFRCGYANPACVFQFVLVTLLVLSRRSVIRHLENVSVKTTSMETDVMLVPVDIGDTQTVLVGAVCMNLVCKVPTSKMNALVAADKFYFQ